MKNVEMKVNGMRLLIPGRKVQFGEGDFSDERGCGLLPVLKRATIHAAMRPSGR